jgi:hypothetical protein
MQLRKFTLAAATALTAAALAPTGASAADQAVTGTTIGSTLALGAPVAATFGTTLGPADTVDSAGGSVAVTAVGSWVMRASGTNGGKLAATAVAACDDSTAVLNNALRVFPTAALGNFTASSTSATPQTLSGSATQVASGTGSNTITLTYRHIPSSSDQFTPACPYTLTSTVDIASS